MFNVESNSRFACNDTDTQKYFILKQLDSDKQTDRSFTKTCGGLSTCCDAGSGCVLPTSLQSLVHMMMDNGMVGSALGNDNSKPSERKAVRAFKWCGHHESTHSS